MGISRNGRFAAVTNVREKASPNAEFLSRGELVTDFLNSTENTVDCLEIIKKEQHKYAGFNLLAGEFSARHSHLYYLSNRQETIEKLAPGIHGLSNGTLNQPWPKVTKGIRALKDSIETCQQAESIVPVLFDSQVADDKSLPDTGIAIELERVLSSRFITTESYGTRAATVLTLNANREVSFYEQEFREKGERGTLNKQEFTITDP